MISITSPDTRYEPATSCIYCGATTEALTDEHIVPFGIAGDSLVYPKSSCTKCQKVTSKTEVRCLRHLWWPFRTRIGSPSQNGTAPSEFSLKKMRVEEYDRENDVIVKYTQLSMEDVPVEDFPVFFSTIELPEAGLLAGRVASDAVPYKLWMKQQDSPNPRHQLKEKEGYRVGPGRPESICRMLAKIAHGFAVAELGQDCFDPLVAGYAVGEDADRLQFIGGLESEKTESGILHKLSLAQSSAGDVNYLVVDVHLFACIGTPAHRVVVGRLHKPLAESGFEGSAQFEVKHEGVPPLAEVQALRGSGGG